MSWVGVQESDAMVVEDCALGFDDEGWNQMYSTLISLKAFKDEILLIVVLRKILL